MFGRQTHRARYIRPSPMNRQNFVLLDLFSQARAVQRHVRDWSRAEVLTWLRRWGTLYSWQPSGFPETHAFHSWCGMGANFTLENGTFTFLGDNTVISPPE